MCELLLLRGHYDINMRVHELWTPGSTQTQSSVANRIRGIEDGTMRAHETHITSRLVPHCLIKLSMLREIILLSNENIYQT